MKSPVARRLLSRDSFKGRRLIRKHSKNFDLYFSPCHYGKNEIVFEGFVKVDGGVKHLTFRYESVSVLGAFADTLEHGIFSPRPYQLGQACDGSITECALALFARFCRELGHSATTLHRDAYPDENRRRPNWPELTAAADWQGVAYPSQWDAGATAGLLESLHAVNYHSLAGVVSHRLEKAGAVLASSD